MLSNMRLGTVPDIAAWSIVSVLWLNVCGIRSLYQHRSMLLPQCGALCLSHCVSLCMWIPDTHKQLSNISSKQLSNISSKQRSNTGRKQLSNTGRKIGSELRTYNSTIADSSEAVVGITPEI